MHLIRLLEKKLDGTLTRRKLKGTCLLVEFEPRNVKDGLENESWIETMKEGIEKIEKNKPRFLFLDPRIKI